MPRYVAFLRAVNVAGARTVKMEVLRGVFEELGFSNVASYLASGNIIFESPARSRDVLEHRIERELLQELGYKLTPFLRTGLELASIISFKAFPRASLGIGDQLGIVFLSSPPDAGARQVLGTFLSQTDEFEVHGREIYWLRHTAAPGAAYSTVPLDKALTVPFTIRTMSTVRKLVEKYVFANRSPGHS